jgi:hypothetical protein
MISMLQLFNFEVDFYRQRIYKEVRVCDGKIKYKFDFDYIKIK